MISRCPWKETFNGLGLRHRLNSNRMLFVRFLHHKLFTGETTLKWSFNSHAPTHKSGHTQQTSQLCSLCQSQSSNSSTVSMVCGREVPRKSPSPLFPPVPSHSFKPSHWSWRNIRHLSICLTMGHYLTLEMHKQPGLLEENQAKAFVSWKYVENILQHDHLKFQWLC